MLSELSPVPLVPLRNGAGFSPVAEDADPGRDADGGGLPSLISPQEACAAWEADSGEAMVRWRPDGMRTAVNAAYCRRYASQPAGLIGTNLLAVLNPDQRLRMERQVASLTPESPSWMEQKPGVTPQGKQNWQEWVTRGFFNADGRLVELQSLGRDITLQKELSLAMDEISRSLLTIRGGRYFEHLVRHLSRVLESDACYAGEIVRDGEGAPGFRFLGISVDGALETLPDALLPGTPLEGLMTEGFVSLTHQAYARFPRDPLLRRVRAQSMVAAAIRDHEGTVLGAVGVLFRQPMAETDFYTASVVRLTAAVGASRLMQLKEIQRREALERQLRESQKMEAVGQLAGGIAHDFNNLLTIMAGHAALLQSLPLPEAAADSVREIVDSTARAASLTRQLLMFSRRQVLQFGAHDLNGIVTGAARLLARLVPENIRLKLDLNPHPLRVEADPGMVEQVMMNLIVNARDAMPSGGQLTLSTRPHQGSRETALTALPFARLSVVDTGTGIAPENLGRIFEPFFTTKETGRGTGIGLATVYTIIEQHQGHIDAESTPGAGTAMHVYLPLLPTLPAEGGSEGTAAANALARESEIDFKATSIAKTEAITITKTITEAEAEVKADPSVEPSVEVSSGAMSGQRVGQGETVLVVEDEAPLRMLVRRILEKQGYRVVEAASGRRAMEFSAEDVAAARLLITDLVMPEGVNGWETADHLRARNPELRVIYTSGYDARTAGQSMTMPDGSGFLQKPWQSTDFTAGVRAMLDR